MENSHFAVDVFLAESVFFAFPMPFLRVGNGGSFVEGLVHGFVNVDT